MKGCSLLRWISTGVLLATLTGCYEDKQMVLDLSGGKGFYDSGFPSDLRRNPDNSIDLNSFPQPLNATVRNYVRWAEQNQLGFAPNTPLYMRFEGHVASSYLSLSDNPADYASTSAAIQLVDIDPASHERGKRFPVRVSYREEGDEYRPDGLLQVLNAGRPLQENTKYGLFVTRQIAPDHADNLIPNPVLTALLEGRDPRAEDKKIDRDDAEKALVIYAPLREQLAQDSIEAESVIGATVWTTGTMSQPLRNLGRWASEQPAPTPVSDFEVLEVTQEYCVLTSSWVVPGLQGGLFPYALTGGRIQYDSLNNPLIQYTRETPLVVTVPRSAMPTAGFPMMFYNHGTAGYATQAHYRGITLPDGVLTITGSPAQVAAQRGWATAGMGGHMGADHEDSTGFLNAIADLIPGLSLNIGTYNFINLPAMRGNFEQSVVERVLFRRLVNNLQIDGSLCPGADSYDGWLRFDDKTQVVMGQSLGAMTGIAQAAIDPEPFQGVIGTGAGSYNLGLVMNLSVIGGKPLGHTLEPLFYFTGKNDVVGDDFHPLWMLTQQSLAPVDFSIHAARWTRNGQAEQGAPHRLIVEGYFDEWVGLYNQVPLLVALGTDLFGNELNVSKEEQLLTSLNMAGYQQWLSPVAGNRNGKTSAVVRFEEDGIKSGHHVVFQQEGVRHQYGCFLQNIKEGRAPIIPLPAGRQNDPCF